MPEHTKPRIAIPVPTSSNATYNDANWTNYAAAVEAEGGEAVRMALDLPPAEAATLLAGCAGIVLPGSPADVHPQKYGQEAQRETAKDDPAREATDELLLQDAFNLRKPMLCVCFGLQMMNVWRGGTLVQHLATGHPHSAPSGSGPLTHSMAVEAEASLLRSFFRDQPPETINSSHHQAVDQPGDGLRVAARSVPDGVVEAVEALDPGEQFILGVQWHPERSFATDEPSREMFSALVAAAHRWRLPHA